MSTASIISIVQCELPSDVDRTSSNRVGTYK